MRNWSATLVLLAICLAACGQPATTQEPTAEKTAAPISGRITFAGSTTVQPLVGKIGQVFQKQYPGVTLDIAAGGTAVGIKAIHDGTVDIGMASRTLKPDEAEGIKQYQIAVDVIAVVVHPSNSMKALSLEQLRAIYLGETTNWDELGGPAQPISVVVREKSSGTRGAFDEIVLEKQEPSAPDLQTAVTAGDMAALVAKDPRAIGYVGFGNMEANIKTLAIDKTLPSEGTARDGSYRLTRPLLLLSGPLSQPLAQEFINFALSAEGQKVAAESGWVSIK